MNITKNKDGSKLTLTLEGRLDTTTAPQLEGELKSTLEGVTNLEFDFRTWNTCPPPACGYCWPLRRP